MEKQKNLHNWIFPLPVGAVDINTNTTQRSVCVCVCVRILLRRYRFSLCWGGIEPVSERCFSLCLGAKKLNEPVCVFECVCVSLYCISLLLQKLTLLPQPTLPQLLIILRLLMLQRLTLRQRWHLWCDSLVLMTLSWFNGPKALRNGLTYDLYPLGISRINQHQQDVGVAIILSMWSNETQIQTINYNQISVSGQYVLTK